MKTDRTSAAPILSSRGQRLGILPSNARTQRLEKRLGQALPQLDLQAIAYAARLPGATYETSWRYLNPYSYEELQRDVLPAYDKLQHMEDAAERLADAVIKGEAFGISGDYDCDGNCSTALMVRFLQESGVKPSRIHVHIPNREREGYGVNRDAVEAMAGKSSPVELLMALDNGTLAHKPLALAKERGMDAIVIDHHPNGDDDDLPKDVMVVNPRRADESDAIKNDPNGVGDLAAVGVTWLVCRRAVQKLAERGYYPTDQVPDPRNWLGLVAMATQADVVDISKPLNRALLKEGLNVINEGRDRYISALARVAQVADPTKLTETDISFNLGPIVNAPGRLGQSVAWAFLTPPDATAEPLDQFMASADLQTKDLHQALQQQRDSLRTQRFAEANPENDRAMDKALRFAPWQMKNAIETEKRILEKREMPAPHIDIDPRLYALMLLSRESNSLRKLIEGAVTREARPQARSILETHPDSSVLLLNGKGWHEGVVGIVAGRIKEEFNLPTVVASVLPPDKYGQVLCKASARSIKVPGFPVDIGSPIRDKRAPGEALDAFKEQLKDPALSDGQRSAFIRDFDRDHLLRTGGGHPMAAGLGFSYTNLEAVRAHLNATLKEPLIAAKKAQRSLLAGAIDLTGESTGELRHWLQAQQALRPCGEGNRTPLVGLYGCSLSKPQIMGKNEGKGSGKHLEFTITVGDQKIAATAFHAVGTDLEKTLSEAARKPDNRMHLLVGSFEAPLDGTDRSKEPMPVFQLQDVLALPVIKGQNPSDALATALDVRPQDLSGVMKQTPTSKGIMR